MKIIYVLVALMVVSVLFTACAADTPPNPPPIPDAEKPSNVGDTSMPTAPPPVPAVPSPGSS